MPLAADALSDAAAAAPGRLLLWRGEGAGSDVDLLALPGADEPARRAFRGHGLTHVDEGPGRSVWHGCELPLDVMAWSAWPDWYPSLAGMVDRARAGSGPLPVASPEDRCLILAVELVLGRPLSKIGPKLRAALREADRERLREVARDERALRLVCTAFAHRVRGRLGRERAPARRPLLVALSGMDGSGKSSAAEVIGAALADAGVAVETSWWRLTEEPTLDRIAHPIKRALGWRGTVADVVAAGGRPEGPPPRQSALRRAVGWAWTLVVAASGSRSFRVSTRQGVGADALVLDRWRADALVDLEVRYGRHRAALALLRALVPPAGVAVWLRVDPRVAARRKPGDQDPGVLARMAPVYLRTAISERCVPVDTSAPIEQVERELREIAGAVASRCSARPASG